MTTSLPPLQSPSIILIKPQMGENIGMVARAMLNCGLTDLRLVAPRDGWPNPSADSASSGALSKGVEVRVYDKTEQAIADLHYVIATTARPRDMIKTVMTPETAISHIIDLSEQNQDRQCGVLFGGERSGLDNEDVALSNAILNVPLNPDFSSLNLAQAVLLVGYEWMKNTYGKMAPPQALITGDTQIASRDSLQNLLSRLEEQLEQHHFFRSEDLKPSVMRNLVNLFSRMDVTEQEISTFHGIISALTGKKPASPSKGNE